MSVPKPKIDVPALVETEGLLKTSPENSASDFIAARRDLVETLKAKGQPLSPGATKAEADQAQSKLGSLVPLSNRALSPNTRRVLRDLMDDSSETLLDADIAEYSYKEVLHAVAVGTVGGFTLGWGPAWLLHALLKFNAEVWQDTNAAPGRDAHAIANAIVAAGALIGAIAWRLLGANVPLIEAHAKLMSALDVDSDATEEERQSKMETVLETLGWSSFVQGVLIAAMLIPVLTLVPFLLIVAVSISIYTADQLEVMAIPWVR